MSNAVRNGISTLNRLLGKKNKNEKNPTNGLSKSSTRTLTRSTSNLDDTASQQNKISPLPAAGNNAPFEQTFRITVCLPLDQLYVVRIGAKTKLFDLLQMVCTNKLLDPNKFEFRHPIDGTQIFELDYTIGEVGLNEIKLAPKQYHSAKDDVVKYRSNHTLQLKKQVQSHQTEYRYAPRPHTISASPYSSTNSLNSSDSSGLNSSLRSSHSLLPAAPCRKKRIAPRPPSQNSIPEDREQKCSKAPTSQTIADNDVDDNAADDGDNDGVFKRPLLRQNFHVSSPNLSNNNNNNLRLCNNESSADTSITSNGDIETRNIEDAPKRQLARPLSMQFNGNSNSHHEFNRQRSDSTNSTGTGNHSRTSSDTSDIAKDGSLPEPTPRKRIFIAKKKAPAPPPRTTTANAANFGPVATPRNLLQKLNEGQPKDEHEEDEQKGDVETTPNETIKEEPSLSPTNSVSPKKSIATANISKVMLNVDENIVLPSNESDKNVISSNDHNEMHEEFVFSQKIIQNNQKMTPNGNQNISRTQINGSTPVDNEGSNKVESAAPISKPKSISVVELNVDKSEEGDTAKPFDNGEKKLTESIDINHEEISQQVNDIIQQALEINEAKLTAANNLKNKADCPSSKIEEINNNENYYSHINSNPESPLWFFTLPAPPVFADKKGNLVKSSTIDVVAQNKTNNVTMYASSPKESNSDANEFNGVLDEIPIKPILNDKRELNFQEYSDNSLPVSSISTTNTNGTEPESSITSDIEDGYKGNDVEAPKSIIEFNREEFIENEFEFLKEHLIDTQQISELDAIVDKTQNEVEKVIEYNSNDAKTPIIIGNSKTNGKTDIIDELTHIISTNRLDTVIKPSDDNDEIDAVKRSSLANFQIGAYTNGHHENITTKPISSANHTFVNYRYKRHSLTEHSPSNANSNVMRKSSVGANPPIKRVSLTNGLGLNNEKDGEAFQMLKQVNRSMSFHAARNADNCDNRVNSGSLSLAPRSTSYISLIGMQKYENSSDKMRNGELNDATRQKSTSELSIADSPSLQSLEVMKSILNSSRAKFSNGLPVRKSSVGSNAKQMNSAHSEATEDKNSNHNGNGETVENAVQPESSTPKPTVMPKTWKYHGPPAINLSTWGERPKSHVFIKSDNDYKFGGVLKMAALQKRFSASTEEKQFHSLNAYGSEKTCETDVYKLPVVRGVEYKKNIVPNRATAGNGINESTDSTDNTVQLQATRPSYEVSRIVSDKSFSDNKMAQPHKTMTLGRVPIAKNFSQPSENATRPFNSINTNSVIQRISSFSGTNDTFVPIVKGFKSQDIANYSAASQNGPNVSSTGNGLHSKPILKFETYNKDDHNDGERLSFSQFTLRKTGLKEKILDESKNQKNINRINCTQPNSINSLKSVIRNTTNRESVVNRHLIPTVAAPKPPPPPPVLKKPSVAGASTLHSTSPPEPKMDFHNQLLDSIKNFNRDALKRH